MTHIHFYADPVLGHAHQCFRKTAKLIVIFLLAVINYDLRAQEVDEFYPLVAGLPDRDRIILAEISPDGQNVVYVRRLSRGNDQLFVVPIAGGTPKGLTRPFENRQLVVITSIQITQDNRRVLFVSNQETDAKRELFSVPLEGGDLVKLSPQLGIDRNISDFKLSPNGEHVVYRADQRTDRVSELFRVPISGGASTPLNPPLESFADVFEYQVSSDSRRVVYTADQITNAVGELFSVAIDGSDFQKLNKPAITEFGQSVTHYQISPDGSRVVYLSNQNDKNLFELFSVPIVGGNVLRVIDPAPVLDPPNQVSGRRFILNDFKITADSNFVVYRGDSTTQRMSELFRVPITGTRFTRLSQQIDDDEDMSELQLSGDGERVVYAFGANPIGSGEIQVPATKLFGVSLAGDNRVDLTPSLASGEEISNIEYSPDNTQIIFQKKLASVDANQLFRVAARGGIATPISDPLTFRDRDGQELIQLISNDGAFVVYVSPDQKSMFSVRIADSNTGDDNPENQQDELCVPVIAKNHKLALVCL